MQIRARVQKAKDIQIKRFKSVSDKITSNAEMRHKDIKIFCPLSRESQSLLNIAVDKMGLSARSYHRIIKLSRTIADLGGSVNINPPHIAEALQYRPRLER